MFYYTCVVLTASASFSGNACCCLSCAVCLSVASQSALVGRPTTGQQPPPKDVVWASPVQCSVAHDTFLLAEVHVPLQLE